MRRRAMEERGGKRRKRSPSSALRSTFADYLLISFCSSSRGGHLSGGVSSTFFVLLRGLIWSELSSRRTFVSLTRTPSPPSFAYSDKKKALPEVSSLVSNDTAKRKRTPTLPFGCFASVSADFQAVLLSSFFSSNHHNLSNFFLNLVRLPAMSTSTQPDASSKTSTPWTEAINSLRTPGSLPSFTGDLVFPDSVGLIFSSIPFTAETLANPLPLNVARLHQVHRQMGSFLHPTCRSRCVPSNRRGRLSSHQMGGKREG